MWKPAISWIKPVEHEQQCSSDRCSSPCTSWLSWLKVSLFHFSATNFHFFCFSLLFSADLRFHFFTWTNFHFFCFSLLFSADLRRPKVSLFTLLEQAFTFLAWDVLAFAHFPSFRLHTKLLFTRAWFDRLLIHRFEKKKRLKKTKTDRLLGFTPNYFFLLCELSLSSSSWMRLYLMHIYTISSQFFKQRSFGQSVHSVYYTHNFSFSSIFHLH